LLQKDLLSSEQHRSIFKFKASLTNNYVFMDGKNNGMDPEVPYALCGKKNPTGVMDFWVLTLCEMIAHTVENSHVL